MPDEQINELTDKQIIELSNLELIKLRALVEKGEASPEAVARFSAWELLQKKDGGKEYEDAEQQR